MQTINPVSYCNKSQIYFKEYISTSKIKSETADKNIDVNNYTSFFRNYDTLKFTTEYITKNFPNGTHIAEFGCSLGQKPYSLMVMLHPENSYIMNHREIQKKYKITGYDFPEVINLISDTGYLLSPISSSEAFLCRPNLNYGIIPREDGRILRKTFFDYFYQLPLKQVSIDEYNEAVDIINGDSDKKDISPKSLKKYNDIFNIYLTQTSGVDPILVKPYKMVSDIVDFKPGNIKNIDTILSPGKTGVIIFQNALYHILYKDLYYKSLSPDGLQQVGELFLKINNILPKNGIFVLGNFEKDHMYTTDIGTTNCHYNNMCNGLVYEDSPVHKLLKKSGFEPVYYEKTRDVWNSVIYLPSVWKKVRNV